MRLFSCPSTGLIGNTKEPSGVSGILEVSR